MRVTNTMFLGFVWDKQKQRLAMLPMLDTRINRIKSAIIQSLFTDAAATDDELAFYNEQQRGWWADAEQSTGSKLWLLQRQKITKQNINAAKQFAEDALQWLLQDELAQINVIASRISNGIAYQIDCAFEDGEAFSIIAEHNQHGL